VVFGCNNREAGEESKPLIILGNIHSVVESGHCIAILNPSEGLLNQVVAGYSSECSGTENLDIDYQSRCLLFFGTQTTLLLFLAH